jgi:hypothetical protein
MAAATTSREDAEVTFLNYPPAALSDGMRTGGALATHLRAGHGLQPKSSAIRLQEGESEYTQLWADGFRFHSVDGVTYNHSSFIAFGSVPLLAATAGGSAMLNARKRKQAQAQAAAQWRPMGQVGVTITSQRMLVLREMTWESLWFGHVIQAVPQLQNFTLDMIFEGAPPFRFSGPNVPYMAVMLIFLLHGEVLDIPAPPAPERPPSQLGPPT